MIQSSFSGRLLVVTLLLAVASVSPLAIAENAPTAVPSDGGETARLQPFVDKSVIAGAVILVADKDKVLDLETVGYADLETKKPMQTDNLFAIASMTKVFTSAGLMMLVDEGKVKLDDTVEKYLPEFKDLKVQEEGKPPHPANHPITIREIMSHTAGLGGNPPKGDTLEAFIKELAKRPLEFDPGTKYKYSLGPAVGGRIIEVVTGVPYPQYIQQKLLDPLGLKDTTFWPDEQQAAHLALTYHFNTDTKKLESEQHPADRVPGMPAIIASQFGGSMNAVYANHFGNPAGGLFSTATDISRFCRMLLNNGTFEGKHYLSEAAVKEMGTLQTGKLSKGDQGYGIGCFVQTKTIPGGPSLGSFGHHGARKTQMWIDPQNGLVMILMLQSGELTHEQQDGLYAAYRQQAIAKYGKTAK